MMNVQHFCRFIAETEQEQAAKVAAIQKQIEKRETTFQNRSWLYRNFVGRESRLCDSLSWDEMYAKERLTNIRRAYDKAVYYLKQGYTDIELNRKDYDGYHIDEWFYSWCRKNNIPS